MPTRNVVLTDYQEQFIAEQVNSGRYKNASEVMREAIRIFERREAENEARLQVLHQAIKQGEADFVAGRYENYTKDWLDQLDAEVVAEHVAEHAQKDV